MTKRFMLGLVFFIALCYGSPLMQFQYAAQDDFFVGGAAYSRGRRSSGVPFCYRDSAVQQDIWTGEIFEAGVTWNWWALAGDVGITLQLVSGVAYLVHGVMRASGAHLRFTFKQLAFWTTVICITVAGIVAFLRVPNSTIALSAFQSSLLILGFTGSVALLASWTIRAVDAVRKCPASGKE